MPTLLSELASAGIGERTFTGTGGGAVAVDDGGTPLVNVLGSNVGRDVVDRELFLEPALAGVSDRFVADEDLFRIREPRLVQDPTVGRAVREETNVFASVTTVNVAVTDAILGVRNLRELLRNPEPTEEDRERALFARLEDYIDAWLTGEAINETFPGRAEQVTSYFPVEGEGGAFRRPAFDTGDTRLDEIEREIQAAGMRAGEVNASLYRVGKIMTEDASTAQRQRHGLVRLRRARQRDLARRRDELATLEQDIVARRRALDALQRTRLEALGDATAAQRLAVEDFRATEARYAERQRILENHLGLSYVRVRESPVSLPLADPQSLRPHGADDSVPGFGEPEGELAAALGPFVDLVLEIPVDDWAALEGGTVALPGRERLSEMFARRAARLSHKRSEARAARSTPVRLAPLQAYAVTAYTALPPARLPVKASLSAVQAQSAAVLSLEDVLTGPRGALRTAAETLRADLELALLRMEDRLAAVPAGARLAWAEAAEDDALAVERPDRWPALEHAGETETLRTLFDLLDWWFARLSASASGASRTAMRNTVRALLMLSADDDPRAILQGVVTVPPGRLVPGAPVRIALNREATPGVALELVGPAAELVALVRVEDVDEAGAVASVAEVYRTDVAVDARATVIGRSGRRR